MKWCIELSLCLRCSYTSSRQTLHCKRPTRSFLLSTLNRDSLSPYREAKGFKPYTPTTPTTPTTRAILRTRKRGLPVRTLYAAQQLPQMQPWRRPPSMQEPHLSRRASRMSNRDPSNARPLNRTLPKTSTPTHRKRPKKNHDSCKAPYVSSPQV